MHRDQSGWIAEYQNKEGLWIHDGNLKRPHALLTSGKHSSGFFNSRKIIPDTALLKEAAEDLLELFTIREKVSIMNVNCFVGPQTGATKLARLLCDAMFDHHGHAGFWVSPEKKEVDGVKSMVFNRKDASLLIPEFYCLFCEDVLTTGGSVLLAEHATKKIGAMILPYVLVLVNRSGLKETHGKKIVALIDYEMPIWTPEECPLCKQGSQAVRPKENWDLLTATY